MFCIDSELSTFYSTYKSTAQPIFATYLISGISSRNDATTKQANGAVERDHCANDLVPNIKVIVAEERCLDGTLSGGWSINTLSQANYKIQDAKLQFDTILSTHVYSISPSQIKVIDYGSTPRYSINQARLW